MPPASDWPFVVVLAAAPALVLLLGGLVLWRRRAQRRAMEAPHPARGRPRTPVVPRSTRHPAYVPPAVRRISAEEARRLAVHDESVVLPLYPLPPLDAPFCAPAEAGEPWRGGGGAFSGGGATGSWDDETDSARRTVAPLAAAAPLVIDTPSFDPGPSSSCGASDSGSTCDSGSSGGCDSGGGSCGE